jgi:hypothetical protein
VLIIQRPPEIKVFCLISDRSTHAHAPFFLSVAGKAPVMRLDRKAAPC